MECAILALSLVCATPLDSLAQVRQSGNVTPTHFATWTTNGVIQDGGIAANPFASTGGVQPGPWCVNSGPNTGAYQAFCMNASSTGATLSIQNFGGAPAGGISFNINGTPSTFPTVVTPTVNGDLASFNNTTGTLTDSGLASAGVNANVLNSQTANHAIETSDCSKTIQLGTGSTGLFTLTVPAVTGFPATCTVFIVNGDITRGKIISGITIPNGPVLFPGQILSLSIVNGAWVQSNNPAPWIPTGNVTFCVDATNGSDTIGDGLTSYSVTAGVGSCATPGQAFKTMQHCVDVVSGQIIVYAPNVQIVCKWADNASIAQTVQFRPMLSNTLYNNNQFTVSGNCTTPGNVVIKGRSVGTVFIAQAMSQAWLIDCLDINPTSSNDNGIEGDWFANLNVKNVRFTGAMISAIEARYGSEIEILTGAQITISANLNQFCSSYEGGRILGQGGAGAETLTLSGNPAWGNAFAVVQQGGMCDLSSFTFSGASTGSRFFIAQGDLGAATGSNYPGNSAGTFGTAISFSQINALQGGSGTILASQIANSTITNAMLVNSSLTVGIGANVGISTSGCGPVSLGGTCTLGATTDTWRIAGLGLGIAAPATGLQIGNAIVAPNANGQLAAGGSLTLGAVISGQGSTNDVTIENKSGTVACSLATGSTNWNCGTFQTPNLQTAYTVTAASGTNGSFGMGAGGNIFFTMGSVADGFIIRDHNANPVFTIQESTPGTTSTTVSTFLGASVAGGSAPAASGTCTINTQVGGNTAGSFKANGACAAGTVILTFSATAPNGYVCDAQDETTSADTVKQTAHGTNSVTFTATMANADVIVFKCIGF